MDEKPRSGGPEEAPARWEKPVVTDVSLESDEDVLGACFSPSTQMVGPGTICGPNGICSR